MIKIVRSGEHYHSNDQEWLSTYWHFSFADYRDPQNMNFGPLRVFNDDTIKPGKGFGMHPHRDMEIITYVVDGELEHRDDRGNRGVIRPGEVQRMTAGTGIMHSEYNHSKEKPLRLLQMWIFANRRGLAPSWEQHRFAREEREGRLLPVVLPEEASSGQGENGKAPLRIHQDAAIYVSSLPRGGSVEHQLGKGRKAYLFVIEGKVRLAGTDQVMETRDAARIENESALLIKNEDSERPSELILLDLPGKYAINN